MDYKGKFHVYSPSFIIKGWRVLVFVFSYVKYLTHNSSFGDL